MCRTAFSGWVLALACCLTLGAPGAAAAGDLTGTVRLPNGKSAEDSVVYITQVSGPAYAPGPPAVMSQVQLRFSPQVLVILKGQRVMFVNEDQLRHDVFSLSKPHRFSLGSNPPGVRKEETFDRSGVVALLCNAHPDMSGFIVVVDTPFFFKTGTDGRFEIKGVPPGKHHVVGWHEGYPEFRQVVDLSSRAVLEIMLKKD